MNDFSPTAETPSGTKVLSPEELTVDVIDPVTVRILSQDTKSHAEIRLETVPNPLGPATLKLLVDTGDRQIPAIIEDETPMSVGELNGTTIIFQPGDSKVTLKNPNGNLVDVTSSEPVEVPKQTLPMSRRPSFDDKFSWLSDSASPPPQYNDGGFRDLSIEVPRQPTRFGAVTSRIVGRR